VSKSNGDHRIVFPYKIKSFKQENVPAFNRIFSLIEGHLTDLTTAVRKCQDKLEELEKRVEDLE